MPLINKNNFVLIGLASGLMVLPAAGQSLDATKHGESLVKRWCVSCHLTSGAASGTDAAPTLRQIRERTRKDPDHIRNFLSRPHTPMPPLQLSREDISDIVAYLGSPE